MDPEVTKPPIGSMWCEVLHRAVNTVPVVMSKQPCIFVEHYALAAICPVDPQDRIPDILALAINKETCERVGLKRPLKHFDVLNLCHTNDNAAAKKFDARRSQYWSTPHLVVSRKYVQSHSLPGQFLFGRADIPDHILMLVSTAFATFR